MSSRKSKQSKEVQIIPSQESPAFDEKSDGGLQASKTRTVSKPVETPVGTPAPVQTVPDPVPKPVKPKRKMTEAQLASLAKGREKAKATLKAKNDAINEKKKAVKDVEAELREAKQREFDEKIVRKALSIKKKAIKKESVLDEVSDDDTPIEEIQEIKRKTAARKKKAPEPEPEPVPEPKPHRQGPVYKFV
jgi:uncharacterized protein (UPF0335 family)